MRAAAIWTVVSAAIAIAPGRTQQAAAPANLPPGKPMIWEDRGSLTPTRVYFAQASETSDPLSRLPLGPFSHFEKDLAGSRTNPKAKLTDSRGIRWTVKWASESRSDIAAPRLAWALGFGSVECYSVPGGHVEGITSKTDLGRAGSWVHRDGTLIGPGRFKRHDKEADEIHDSEGKDINWDEAHNPGVPPEQLSGLILFDVLVVNWDSQPKNSKVLHVTGKDGPENWFIESDLGATFADRWWNKFDLPRYRKAPPMVKAVIGDTVELNYVDQSKAEELLHRQVSLAHARWFRGQLMKLTDENIRAAFDAAFATDGLNRAYATGDSAQIRASRETELSTESRAVIDGFVAAVRARIDAFKAAIHPQ